MKTVNSLPKKSEDKLKERIIKTFKNINRPDERIIDKHGLSELGLDLILLKKDPFGFLRAYGIQLKTGDIKCSGKPTNRLKEIIGQISIAFGKKVRIDGKDYNLDGFYVITDGHFVGQSEDYIASACVGIRNLHFIDGSALNEFFAKNEPTIDQFKET